MTALIIFIQILFQLEECPNQGFGSESFYPTDPDYLDTN